MKRLVVLSGLLAVGAVSMIFAQPQPQQKPPALEIEKVKDNLYMISGAGGNTAVFVTETGVVIVDTKVPGTGPAILDKVKSITPKPVIMVINTHTHFDHVGSNIAFTGMVEFVAHENCKTSMEKMAAFQSDEGKKFLPGKTYKDKLSLLKGNDKIDLYYFGRGHTGGDTFVVFPALKVMHAGDMFAFTSGLPLIDVTTGGSGLEYPRTLLKAAATIKGVEKVIPGHSPVTDWSAFKGYGEFIQAFVAAVEQSKKDGKTVEQAVADLKLPEKYKDYKLGGAKGGVTEIYNELK
jgi:cyclase